MNSGYTVDLDQLDNIVTQLSSLAGFITEHLDTLDQKSAAVHAGSWSGAAATAHEVAHREWSAAAREFVQGIADMTVAARSAHVHYTAAVDSNSRMLGGR